MILSSQNETPRILLEQKTGTLSWPGTNNETLEKEKDFINGELNLT